MKTTPRMKNPPKPPVKLEDEFVSFGVHTIHGGNEAFNALITQDSKRIVRLRRC